MTVIPAKALAAAQVADQFVTAGLGELTARAFRQSTKITRLDAAANHLHAASQAVRESSLSGWSGSMDAPARLLDDAVAKARQAIRYLREGSGYPRLAHGDALRRAREASALIKERLDVHATELDASRVREIIRQVTGEPTWSTYRYPGAVAELEPGTVPRPLGDMIADLR